MPNPAVSVIVPARNAGSLLQSCIDSIRRQSLADFELILVDDASDDETPSIIAAAAADNRVVTLRLDRQRGAAGARNRGIERARGDYLVFVDADDFWGRDDMLAELLASARAHAADLVTFGFERVDMQGRSLGTCTDPEGCFHPASDDGWRIRYNPWAKFIDRRFVLRHALRFDESLPLAEDAAFSVALYCRAERIVNLDRAYYCYRINPRGKAGRNPDPNQLRDILRWFAVAVDDARRCELVRRRPEVLASIAVERLLAFATRLGPLAAGRMAAAEFAAHLGDWADCFAAVDQRALDEAVFALPDARSLARLLAQLRARDAAGVRLALTGGAR